MAPRLSTRAARRGREAAKDESGKAKNRGECYDTAKRGSLQK